ncbi:hypothetical protein HU200_035597 [Digitaria exilis]|uniref:Cytochrome P450 n=1 Tax=Digitaria exilis TaxID=1010633 RepID=A0A835EL65_9POAL|nr:hypothetical protein HU200_035597 [Digitaria exilis]
MSCPPVLPQPHHGTSSGYTIRPLKILLATANQTTPTPAKISRSHLSPSPSVCCQLLPPKISRSQSHKETDPPTIHRRPTPLRSPPHVTRSIVRRRTKSLTPEADVNIIVGLPRRRAMACHPSHPLHDVVPSGSGGADVRTTTTPLSHPLHDVARPASRTAPRLLSDLPSVAGSQHVEVKGEEAQELITGFPPSSVGGEGRGGAGAGRLVVTAEQPSTLGSDVLPLQSEHGSYATEMHNKVFIPDYRFLLTRKNRRVWQLDMEIKRLLGTFDHGMKDYMSFMAPASGDDASLPRQSTALAMDVLAMDAELQDRARREVVEVGDRRSTVPGTEVCGHRSTMPRCGAPTPPNSTRHASPPTATGHGPREQMAAFLPFGGGGRGCIAVIVSKVALALVLQRCEVRPSPAYMDAAVREEPDAEKKGRHAVGS